MSIQKLRPSFTLTEDRLRELQAVIPEAFADGRINWDTLREALGETLEDESQEHFGLFWAGKREARRLAAMPSKGTLIPQPGAGVDEEDTHNLFIEGDNLEVLKLLQKSYAGRVKLIYIDPPYNTGKDRLYKDNYQDPAEDYFSKTGQLNEQGELLTTNSKVDGRFHSNWLNMMYPRLLLAKQLLREDGAILVSIDDNEVHNLRMIMGEIFGEEMFVANVAVVNNMKGRNDRKHIATAHEHLIYFAKPDFESIGLQLTEKQLADYGETDEQGEAFQWRDLRKRGGADTRLVRPRLWFPVYANEMTGEVSLVPSKEKHLAIYPLKSDGTEGCWRWSQEKVEKNLDIIQAFKVEGKNKWNINYRINLMQNGKMRTSKPKSIWIGSQYSTDAGTKALREIISGVDDMTPKAVGFVKAIVQQVSDGSDDDIILDFFAGSCTTAQAVMELNREDGGKRNFIMIQLPEAISNSKFPNIAELGKERIRRIAKQMKKSKQGQLTFEIREFPEDLGLKTFAFNRSSFKDWKNFDGKNTQVLETLFDKFETPLVEGWKPENLLTEIILLQGFPLDSNVRSLPEFKANAVQQVTSEFVTHPLYVCLDKKIKAETVAKLKLGSEDIFVCLDSALSDEAKVKLADQCNLKVI